jgi:hypothetical protein
MTRDGMRGCAPEREVDWDRKGVAGWSGYIGIKKDCGGYAELQRAISPHPGISFLRKRRGKREESGGKKRASSREQLALWEKRENMGSGTCVSVREGRGRLEEDDESDGWGPPVSERKEGKRISRGYRFSFC